MKIATIFCFMCLFLYEAHTQVASKYHNLCYQAADAIEAGNLEMAHVFLVEAFSLPFPKRGIDLFNMAKCQSQNGNTEEAERIIRYLLKNNFKCNSLIRIHVNWFQSIFGEDGWQEIVAETRKTHELPLAIKRIIDELQAMDSESQQYLTRFRLLKESQPNFNDSLAYNAAWDSTNLKISALTPHFDSIIASLPDSILLHPAVEDVFKLNINLFLNHLTPERVKTYTNLIERGFATPDILIDVYFEEFYKKPIIDYYKGLQPITLEFKLKYGLNTNYNSSNLRQYYRWSYDE